MGLLEINSGVNQLDQVTQQNAAVAEEANAAALFLQQRAEDLMQEIARFRVTRQLQPDIAPKRTARNPSAGAGGVPLRLVGGRTERTSQFLEF